MANVVRLLLAFVTINSAIHSLVEWHVCGIRQPYGLGNHPIYVAGTIGLQRKLWWNALGGNEDVMLPVRGFQRGQRLGGPDISLAACCRNRHLTETNVAV